ncbi:hypothetical protein BDN70DRAFT_830008 [Pholiota conissans]|uniref:Uncharacterized protein n=1 Tax=Pholiota conissans TaxID=109636 RepID=A0A9P5Z7D6_9AGAR|nr:hypothetical protein BDN70DRAFT_830008 [Pholiota conissans]
MSALNDSVDNGEVLPVNIVRGTHGQLVLFLVLNMWPSHFGLLVLLAVVLSRRVKRHATFVNLCVTFEIIGISSSLLVYAGRTTGPEPGRMLCLLQASLLYGMPPLTSMAALSLVLQMFFMIKAAYDGVEYLDRDHIIRVWLMLVGPYIVFFTAVIITAVVGAANPFRVSRNRRFFYCSVDSDNLTNTLTIFSAVVLFTACIFMVWTVVLLYRRIMLAKKHGLRPRWTVDLNFPVRILLFGVYVIIALSLSLLSIKAPSSPAPDLVIALAATVLILIFGTQADILHALCFWKSPKPREVLEGIDVDLKSEFRGAKPEMRPTEQSTDHQHDEKPLPVPPYEFDSKSQVY